MIDWLDYNGYKVVTKPAKEFTDSMGRRKIKGNMDIELAIDAMELVDVWTTTCCSPATAISACWSRRCSGAAGKFGHLHRHQPAADDFRRSAPAGGSFH